MLQVLLSLILIAGASAQPCNALPSVSFVPGVQPAPPILPNVFQGFVTVTSLTNESSSVLFNGRIYVDYPSSQERYDYSFVGGVASAVYHFATAQVPTGSISVVGAMGSEPICQGVSFSEPMSSPTVFSDAKFVGFSQVPEAGLCTVWKKSLFGQTATLFVKANPTPFGSIPVLFVTPVSIYHFEGVVTDIPDGIFSLPPNACSSNASSSSSPRIRELLKHFGPMWSV